MAFRKAYRGAFRKAFVGQLGASLNLSTESLALFERMAIEPSTARKIIIDETIRSLKSDGLWDKADVIKFYAAETEQQSLLNWKADNFNSSKVNSPLFTADVGFSKNVAGYINSGFNPTNASKYSKDDATVAVFIKDSADGVVVDVGADISNSSKRTMIGYNYSRLHVNTTPSETYYYTNKNGTGLFGATRLNSSNVRGFNNGILRSTYSLQSSDLVDFNYYELGMNRYNTSVPYTNTGPLSFIFYGSQISDSEWENLNKIVNNYLIKVECIASFNCSIGDSTIAEYAGGTAVYKLINNDRIYPFISLDYQAEHIADQLSKWNALPANIKSQFNNVFVEIGINDCYYPQTPSGLISEYQALINQISSDIGDYCKIIGCTLSPFRGRFNILGGIYAAEAYANWIALNEAITGGGLTPITGLDLVASEHTDTMNAGDGYLKAEYDSGDGGHPNTAGKQVIADSWKNAIT